MSFGISRYPGLLEDTKLLVHEVPVMIVEEPEVVPPGPISTIAEGLAWLLQAGCVYSSIGTTNHWVLDGFDLVSIFQWCLGGLPVLRLTSVCSAKCGVSILAPCS